MRITNNILTNNFMNNYNRALAEVSHLQNQLSSGKAVTKPSDDPVKMVRTLQFNSSLTVNAMYTQNANDAISWMTTSDGAVSSIVSNINSIKTLVSQALGSNTTTSRQAIAEQIDGLIDELVNLGNTKIGDRYVFAGQNDQGPNPPFTYDKTAGAVTYSGTWDGQGGKANGGTIVMSVSPGAPDYQRDKINLDGQQLFGAIDTASSPPNQPAIFKDLISIKNAVANGTVSTNDLGTLDQDLDTIIQAQTTLGARQATYQTMLSRLQSDYVTIKSDLSHNQDLDVAKASIEFQNAVNVYDAALAVGAKILPKSLVDYL